LIEQYFQSLLDLIASLPFIQTPDLSLEKRGELVGFIRGELEFSDESSLHFRELIDLRTPLKKLMYAYHYQGSDGTLVFRYDNTAHHKSVSTYPHHKHLGGGEVSLATQPELVDILREIEMLLSEK
jgi:hypothetical protein